MLHDIVLYKFNIHIHIHIHGPRPVVIVDSCNIHTTVVPEFMQIINS